MKDTLYSFSIYKSLDLTTKLRPFEPNGKKSAIHYNMPPQT